MAFREVALTLTSGHRVEKEFKEEGIRGDGRETLVFLVERRAVSLLDSCGCNMQCLELGSQFEIMTQYVHMLKLVDYKGKRSLGLY